MDALQHVNNVVYVRWEKQPGLIILERLIPPEGGENRYYFRFPSGKIHIFAPVTHPIPSILVQRTEEIVGTRIVLKCITVKKSCEQNQTHRGYFII
jgi:hypothetical protein